MKGCLVAFPNVVELPMNWRTVTNGKMGEKLKMKRDKWNKGETREVCLEVTGNNRRSRSVQGSKKSEIVTVDGEIGETHREAEETQTVANNMTDGGTFSTLEVNRNGKATGDINLTLGNLMEVEIIEETTGRLGRSKLGSGDGSLLGSWGSRHTLGRTAGLPGPEQDAKCEFNPTVSIVVSSKGIWNSVPVSTGNGKERVGRVKGDAKKRLTGSRFHPYHGILGVMAKETEAGKVVRGESDFYLTLFYGNPRVQDRRSSWEQLRKLKRDGIRPWVVMGDFNEITYSWEMESRRERQMWQMKNFRDCLEDCELSDMGYIRETFTYSNRHRNEMEVRASLDRVVENEDRRASFPRALVKHGFANSSDHSPLILLLLGVKKAVRKNLRRFEPMWLRHESFKEEVKKAWPLQTNEASLSEKLQQCMHSLSQWSSATFGSVKKKVEDLKTCIQQVRKKPGTKQTAAAEDKLTGELDEWLEREKLWWRQRSRAEWL
ncbi:hypothetical protein QQ045_025023 [Rhodiola kirilowii]